MLDYIEEHFFIVAVTVILIERWGQKAGEKCTKWYGIGRSILREGKIGSVRLNRISFARVRVEA